MSFGFCVVSFGWALVLWGHVYGCDALVAPGRVCVLIGSAASFVYDQVGMMRFLTVGSCHESSLCCMLAHALEATEEVVPTTTVRPELSF